MQALMLALLLDPTTPKVEVACDDRTQAFNECLTEVCSPASSRKTHASIYAQLETAPLPEDSALLGEMMADLEKARILLNSINMITLGALAEEGSTNIKPEYARLHNYLEMVEAINVIDLDDVVKRPDFRVNRGLAIDKKKLREQLALSYPADKVNRLLEPLKEYLESKEIKSRFLGNFLGWKLAFDELYPGKDMSQIISEEKASRATFKRTLARTQPGVSAFLETTPEYHSELIDVVNPTQEQMKGYFNEATEMKLMERYLTNPPAAFRSMPLQRDLTRVYPKDDLVNLLSAAGNIHTFQSALLTGRVARCQGIRAQNLMAYPSEEERQNFSKVVEDTKAKMVAHVTSSLSAHTLQMVKPRLDEIRIELPPRREDVIKQMDSVLANQAKVLKAQVEQLQAAKDHPENLERIKQGILLRSHRLSTGEGESSISELCDEFMAPGLTDHNVGFGKQKISLSWITMKSAETAPGVIAHELGHSLSAIMRTGKLSKHSGEVYQASRMCTSENFPVLNPREEVIDVDGKKTKYQVSQFVEENWADEYAVNVLGQTDNFGCFMLQKKDMGLSYKESEVLPTHVNDTHAPTLFRALRVHHLQGKELPASCTSALNDVEKKSITTNCQK